METHINSVKAWFLAARPKTLTGAAAPVLVGTALAWHEDLADSFYACVQMPQEESDRAFLLWIHWMMIGIPALLCLLFAFIMQIDANFINDYFDYQKGSDREDRLGPERACAQGWITPGAMRKGIAITTTLGCLMGCLILGWGHIALGRFPWELIAVGLLCVVFSFLYTTHLSYMGLGDLLVLIFFGIIPVGFTYYLITEGKWSPNLTLTSLAMGLATDNLLMVNNYRDRNQDRISGKQTIIVRIIDWCGSEWGAKISRWLYLGLGITAAAIETFVLLKVDSHLVLAPLIYLILHVQTYKKICTLEGKELNKALGATARNIFIFGLLFAVAIVY